MSPAFPVAGLRLQCLVEERNRCNDNKLFIVYNKADGFLNKADSMSSRFSLFIAYSCLLLATACTQRVAKHDHPPHDSSVNALDWAGTYRGDLPCADCAGIEVILTLNADLSWHMQMLYDNGGITRFEREGTFSWEADGNHIRLHGISDAPNRYKVEENRLVRI